MTCPNLAYKTQKLKIVFLPISSHVLCDSPILKSLPARALSPVNERDYLPLSPNIVSL